MTKVNKVVAAVAAVGLTIPWAGTASAVTQTRDDVRQDAQEAQSSAQQAADRAGDRAERAGERAGSATESAADDTRSAAESAAQETEEAAQSAAEKSRSAAQSAAQSTEAGAREAAERTESAAESAANEAGQAGNRASGGAKAGIGQNSPGAGAAASGSDASAQTDGASAPAPGSPDSAGGASAQAVGAVPAPRIPGGMRAKEASDAGGIRDVVASSAEAAFTKGGFDDLVERLVDADRNRIGQNMPQGSGLETLDGRIEQIRQAWKDKYGEDFDMNAGQLFGPQFIGIAQGEVADPAALAQAWPVEPAGASSGSQVAGSSHTGRDISTPETAVKTGETTAGRSTGVDRTTGASGAADDSAQTASSRTPAAREQGGALGERRIEARNLEQGRDVALVRVPSGHGLPELTVSLIHEKPDAWRIDVPDQLSGQKLYDNLLNQLTRVGENTSQWPADKEDAYRHVSHCVLMAVLDVDANQPGQQQQSQQGLQRPQPQGQSPAPRSSPHQSPSQPR